MKVQLFIDMVKDNEKFMVLEDFILDKETGHVFLINTIDDSLIGLGIKDRGVTIHCQLVLKGLYEEGLVSSKVMDRFEAVYDCGKPVVGKKYRHFKGGAYVILAIARCSETNKGLVVYRSLSDGRVWVRPVTNFFGWKSTENGMVERFVEIRE